MLKGITKMFTISLAQEDEEDEFVGDLAAVASAPASPAIVERLPLSFRPEQRFTVPKRLAYGEPAVTPAPFERPDGSFEARAFGNAVHAFVEVLAKRLADGISIDALQREVAGWTLRIAAILRTDGLAPSVVDQLAARVKTGLSNMLKDSEGLWVLSAHEDASSELALTFWSERRSSVRMDRVFLGGQRPLDAGSDCLWIIDYKTATHGREGLDEFLTKERAKYEAQLETYARMMRDRCEAHGLRVGLYYPMLARLIWWAPSTAAAEAAD